MLDENYACATVSLNLYILLSYKKVQCYPPLLYKLKTLTRKDGSRLVACINIEETIVGIFIRSFIYVCVSLIYVFVYSFADLFDFFLLLSYLFAYVLFSFDGNSFEIIVNFYHPTTTHSTAM